MNLSRPHRLARSRTPPFHGGNRGSNPLGDASPNSRLRRILSERKIVPVLVYKSKVRSSQFPFAQPPLETGNLGCGLELICPRYLRNAYVGPFYAVYVERETTGERSFGRMNFVNVAVDEDPEGRRALEYRFA